MAKPYTYREAEELCDDAGLYLSGHWDDDFEAEASEVPFHYASVVFLYGKGPYRQVEAKRMAETAYKALVRDQGARGAQYINLAHSRGSWRVRIAYRL